MSKEQSSIFKPIPADFRNPISVMFKGRPIVIVPDEYRIIDDGECRVIDIHAHRVDDMPKSITVNLVVSNQPNEE